MTTPEFVLRLRAAVGHDLLWLPATCAVVVRTVGDRRQVLLVRRADTGVWTTVTGIVDPGEEPAVAAVREVAEETLVRAEVERLVWLAVTDPVTYDNGDVSQYVEACFACRWIEGEPQVGDDENTEAVFFDVDELPPMAPWYADRVAHVLSGDQTARLTR